MRVNPFFLAAALCFALVVFGVHVGVSLIALGLLLVAVGLAV